MTTNTHEPRWPDEDDWDDENFDQRPPSPAHHQGEALSARQSLVRKTWRPTALPVPQVDQEFDLLGPIERSAEVIRYQCQNAEYWISPGGWLREWIRLNLRVAIFLAIPAITVGPLMTFMLEGVSSWVVHCRTIQASLLQSPFAALLLIGVCLAVAWVIRAFRRSDGRNPWSR